MLNKREMKKNYTRIQSLTSKNFYQKLKNRNDIMRPKIATGEKVKGNPIATTIGFYDIKKYRLHKKLGCLQRKNENSLEVGNQKENI